MGYPGRASGSQNVGATSSYVLEPCSTRKIAQGCQIFLQTGVSGGSCNPTNWHRKKRALWRKPTRWSWWENTNTKTFLPVPCWRCPTKCLFSSPWTLQRMWLNRSHEKFWEFRPRRYRLRSPTGVYFIIRRGQQKICTRVEIFVDWLANQSLLCTTYRVFMSVYLIDLYKHPGFILVGVKAAWRHLFENFDLKVTGPKTRNTC